MVRPATIGHQGCDGLRPGNTLGAFRHALALGADAVECDVHRTRDGRLAVIHDARVDRTTNGRGAVAELAMAELRALDAGGGEPVPELVDVVTLIAASGAGLVVELKAPGTVAPALEAVRRHDLLSRTTFISFRLELLADLRGAEPSARLGALFGSDAAADPEPSLVARAGEVGADLIDLHFAAATPALLAAARQAGLRLWVWTPDEEDDLRRMVAMGVDGITTNRPDRLVSLLGPRPPA